MTFYTTMNKRLLFILFLAFAALSVYARNDRSAIKILAIGNSFSVDAVESYLSDLAIAADVPIDRKSTRLNSSH